MTRVVNSSNEIADLSLAQIVLDINNKIVAKVICKKRLYPNQAWNSEKSMKRVFKNKMYFYPISKSILQRNAKLVQNPGWTD